MNTSPITQTFEEFKKQSLAAGFDEVLERRWAADTVIEQHTHSFSVQAIVTEGEMWLTSHGDTKHLTAGSRFELSQGVPHSERYGAQGTTFWVARKNA